MEGGSSGISKVKEVNGLRDEAAEARVAMEEEMNRWEEKEQAWGKEMDKVRNERDTAWMVAEKRRARSEEKRKVGEASTGEEPEKDRAKQMKVIVKKIFP